MGLHYLHIKTDSRWNYFQKYFQVLILRRKISFCLQKLHHQLLTSVQFGEDNFPLSPEPITETTKGKRNYPADTQNNRTPREALGWKETVTRIKCHKMQEPGWETREKNTVKSFFNLDKNGPFRKERRQHLLHTKCKTSVEFLITLRWPWWNTSWDQRKVCRHL